jgi:hypothetical protein
LGRPASRQLQSATACSRRQAAAEPGPESRAAACNAADAASMARTPRLDAGEQRGSEASLMPLIAALFARPQLRYGACASPGAGHQA